MMVNPDGSRDFFNQYRIFNVGAIVPHHELRHSQNVSEVALRLYRDGGILGAVGDL